MVKIKAIIPIVLVTQMLGLWLMLSNANFFNTNTSLENSLADLGGLLFLGGPLVGATAVLIGTKQNKPGGPAHKLPSVALVLIAPFAAWLVLFAIYQGYAQFKSWQDEQARIQSQERTSKHNQEVQEQREALWSKTCIRANTISIDLQTHSTYRDFSDAKLVIQQSRNANKLTEVNEHISKLNELFRLCSSGEISPTGQRKEILSQLNQVIKLSK